MPLSPLPVFVQAGQGEVTISSLWIPTPEELAALNAGHGIVLTVFGTTHPPVMLECTGEKIHEVEPGS